MPAAAVIGAQLATPVGPVATLGQLVVVQRLAEVAACPLQLATGVGPVTTVLQVVAT